MTTQMRANPLATPAQITAEKEALRIEALPEMQAVREKLRQMMLADPGAQSIDGREALDRVLDQWVRCNILMQLTKEQKEPPLNWNADNTPPSCFGTVFPEAVIAADRPDNSNPVSQINGDTPYVLIGES